MSPTVLTIAGLDPSGGAGIAADLKTATLLKTYGMSVLTTVTVQHPGGVSRVAPLPAAIVGEQLQTIVETMPIHAVKVGLVGSTEVATTIAGHLSRLSVPVVLDPVRRSSSGASLGPEDSSAIARLLQCASVVCPNSEELDEILSGMPAGRWAIENQTAVLHTGGHEEGDTVEDTLWLADGGHRRWRHPRVQTAHTHGTGCTLSTAVAAGLARGLSLPEAAEMAIQFTARLIELSASGGLVDANGPLLHFKIV
jgi:hydroxymethylpyrimidine/phosphomethylpyrimidine kinase